MACDPLLLSIGKYNFRKSLYAHVATRAEKILNIHKHHGFIYYENSIAVYVHTWSILFQAANSNSSTIEQLAFIKNSKFYFFINTKHMVFFIKAVLYSKAHLTPTTWAFLTTSRQWLNFFSKYTSLLQYFHTTVWQFWYPSITYKVYIWDTLNYQLVEENGIGFPVTHKENRFHKLLM